jgi:hypothetical protein
MNNFGCGNGEDNQHSNSRYLVAVFFWCERWQQRFNSSKWSQGTEANTEFKTIQLTRVLSTELQRNRSSSFRIPGKIQPNSSNAKLNPLSRSIQQS